MKLDFTIRRFNPPLQRGMTGSAVSYWQTKLQERNLPIRVTGVFDEQTALVTERVQRDNSLVPDGIVGPVTVAAAERYGIIVGKEIAPTVYQRLMGEDAF